MPTLVTAAYSAPTVVERRKSAGTSEAAAAFSTADDFPYDVGDDPAFFSARLHNGPVTWGVCRSDVRRMVQPDDVVVFFSFSPQGDKNAKRTDYRFVAALTVDRKISHDDIFNGAEARFQNYLNLLIRPAGEGWERHEPAARVGKWHPDWLWRLGAAPERRKAGKWLKEHAEAAGKTHHPGDDLPEAKVRSYVVFSQDRSLVMPDPPLVATHEHGEGQERWNDDTLSKAIASAVFDEVPGRMLRTTNPQQPHRHRRREMDAGWLDRLRDALPRQA